jgi:hypothetical protein
MPETTATYLRPKDVAERFSISKDKLAIDRMKGIGIPFVVFGGSILYSLASCEAHFSANTVTPGLPMPPGIKRRKGGPGRPRRKMGEMSRRNKRGSRRVA